MSDSYGWPLVSKYEATTAVKMVGARRPLAKCLAVRDADESLLIWAVPPVVITSRSVWPMGAALAVLAKTEVSALWRNIGPIAAAAIAMTATMKRTAAAPRRA